jgi:hypothetical protein
VLIHSFDNLEDWSAGRGFAPCNSGWCAGRYDHVSSTLVNAAHPKLFNSRAGVVLSPITPIECAFKNDGGTQSQSLEGACGSGIAFAPDQLKQMIAAQDSFSYNEVLVSIAKWQALMPDIVEAIVFSAGSEQEAREVHEAFVREYASSGRTAENTPLLQYLGAAGFVRVEP